MSGLIGPVLSRDWFGGLDAGPHAHERRLSSLWSAFVDSAVRAKAIPMPRPADVEEGFIVWP